MPRTSFPTSSLNAAAPGLGKLAAAIGGGGDQTFDAARDQGMELQSKLAQALATMNAHEATASLNNAKADGERAGLAMQTPEALRRNAMLSNGIPLDEDGAVENFFRTGKLGGKYAQPGDGIGPVEPQPDWAANLGGVARAIGGQQRALTIGDRNSENVAKAGAIEREGRLSDAIISGTANRNTVGGAQAAAAGKTLFHQDGTGAVLDQYGGQLDTSNPLARSTIGLRTEQAGQAKAGAAENYAQADQARATAAKTRQEIEQGIKTGALQVVTDAEGNITVVNKVSGTGRQVTGADGKPLQGKGQNLNGEQANALTFATRMQAAHDTLLQLADKGVLRPGNTKAIAEGIGHAIPLVGEHLGDALGSATNFTQSAGQQQVEQAERDFINAVLRRESGAAISMGEFKNGKQQYFPQVGDSAEVIAQKAAARERVINGMMQAVPASRRPAAAPPRGAPQTGGATGGWGGPETPAPGGQRNVTVSY